jgi:uncharacterized protein YjbJ (UPF0337 family)
LQVPPWKVSASAGDRHAKPIKEIHMNQDILAGKWQQVLGKVKEQWGKLTDDDLKTAEGKFEKLSGLLQERYGYARERAEDELNRFYKKYVDVDEEARR